MAEIIKFPSHEQKRIRLRNSMNKMIATMDSYYEMIDDIMVELCNLEDKVAEVEVEYSEILREYAKMTEKAKIETRLLAYCRNTDAHWDGDKQQIIFTLEGMNFEDDE